VSRELQPPTNLHKFTCFQQNNVGTNQIKQKVKLTFCHGYPYAVVHPPSPAKNPLTPAEMHWTGPSHWPAGKGGKKNSAASRRYWRLLISGSACLTVFVGEGEPKKSLSDCHRILVYSIPCWSCTSIAEARCAPRQFFIRSPRHHQPISVKQPRQNETKARPRVPAAHPHDEQWVGAAAGPDASSLAARVVLPLLSHSRTAGRRLSGGGRAVGSCADRRCRRASGVWGPAAAGVFGRSFGCDVLVAAACDRDPATTPVLFGFK
jgi:hypothetical protein